MATKWGQKRIRLTDEFDKDTHKILLELATNGNEDAIEFFRVNFNCRIYTKEEIEKIKPIIDKEWEEKLLRGQPKDREELWLKYIRRRYRNGTG